ncbi:hypothetical protein ACRAWF_46275 [Streptomyces sp. L7]
MNEDSTTTARTVNVYYDDTAHPGDSTRTVDARGNTSLNTYDAAGDITSSTNAAGEKTSYGYDLGRGLLTTLVTPIGTAAGTTTSCAPPAKGCTTYAYDAWGNITKTTDALGTQRLRELRRRRRQDLRHRRQQPYHRLRLRRRRPADQRHPGRRDHDADRLQRRRHRPEDHRRSPSRPQPTATTTRAGRPRSRIRTAGSARPVTTRRAIC